MVCQQINLPNQSRILWAYSCAGMNFAAVELYLLKGKGEKWLLYLTFSASIRSFQLMERLCWQFTIRYLESMCKLCEGRGPGTEDLRQPKRPHLFFSPSTSGKWSAPAYSFVGKKEHKALFLNLHKRIDNVTTLRKDIRFQGEYLCMFVYIHCDMQDTKTVFIKHGHYFNLNASF